MALPLPQIVTPCFVSLALGKVLVEQDTSPNTGNLRNSRVSIYLLYPSTKINVTKCFEFLNICYTCVSFQCYIRFFGHMCFKCITQHENLEKYFSQNAEQFGIKLNYWHCLNNGYLDYLNVRRLVLAKFASYSDHILSSSSSSSRNIY